MKNRARTSCSRHETTSLKSRGMLHLYINTKRTTSFSRWGTAKRSLLLLLLLQIWCRAANVSSRNMPFVKMPFVLLLVRRFVRSALLRRAHESHKSWCDSKKYLVSREAWRLRLWAFIAVLSIDDVGDARSKFLRSAKKSRWHVQKMTAVIDQAHLKDFRNTSPLLRQ